MEQLYAVQVDLAKVYPQHSEQYLQAGENRFALHSGGRGNGAQGGLYTKNQLNRIIGKYPAGAAKAIPVAFPADVEEAVESALSKAATARKHAAEEWGSYD